MAGHATGSTILASLLLGLTLLAESLKDHFLAVFKMNQMMMKPKTLGLQLRT
jgi:hypothetical protein